MNLSIFIIDASKNFRKNDCSTEKILSSENDNNIFISYIKWLCCCFSNNYDEL